MILCNSYYCNPHFTDEETEAQRGDTNFRRAPQSESGGAQIQTQPVLSTNKRFCLAPFLTSTDIHFTLLHMVRISFPLLMLPSPSNVISIPQWGPHQSPSLPVLWPHLSEWYPPCTLNNGLPGSHSSHAFNSEISLGPPSCSLCLSCFFIPSTLLFSTTLSFPRMAHPLSLPSALLPSLRSPSSLPSCQLLFYQHLKLPHLPPSEFFYFCFFPVTLLWVNDKVQVPNQGFKALHGLPQPAHLPPALSTITQYYVHTEHMFSIMLCLLIAPCQKCSTLPHSREKQ